MQTKQVKFIIVAFLTGAILSGGVYGVGKLVLGNELEGAVLKSAPTKTITPPKKTVTVPAKTVTPKPLKTKLPLIKYSNNGKSSTWTIPGNNYGVIMPTCNGKYVILQPNSNGITGTTVSPAINLPLPTVEVPTDSGLNVTTPDGGAVQLDVPGSEDTVSLPGDNSVQVYVPVSQNPPADLAQNLNPGEQVQLPGGRSVTFHPPFCLKTLIAPKATTAR